MDVENILKDAEYCATSEGCEGCFAYGNLGLKQTETCCVRGPYHAKRMIAIKYYFEALLKAERGKVVQEVRELIQKSYLIQCPDEGAEWLCAKLDSLEPDKEPTHG